MPILRRIPLRLVVPLLVASAVVVASAALMTVSYLDGRAAARRLAAQSMAQVHARIAARLDGLLGMPKRVNRMNRALIEQGMLDREDLRSWRRMLWEQAHAFDMLSCIEWGDEQGRVVWFLRFPGQDGLEFGIKDEATEGRVLEYRYRDDGTIEDEPKGAYEYDPRVRPWYRAGADAGEPTWTEPYGWVYADGSEVTLGIGYSEPYHDGDGRLLGVVDAELTLHDVSRFLRSLTIGERGLAFVTDRAGRLIATSADVPVTDADLRTLPASACADPRIAGAAPRLEAAGSAGRVDERVDLDGEPHLLVASPFEHETGLRWNIATLVPEREFLAAVEARARRGAIIAIVVVLATVLVAGLFAVRAVRPIVALVDHVERIGAGDLGRVSPEDQAPELARLARAVNAMTRSLRAIVGQVTRSTVEVTSASTEIAGSARHQAQTVDEFLASTERAATAVGGVSTAIEDLAPIVTDASAAMQRAAANAAGGHGKLEALDRVMHGLSVASAALGERVEAIRDSTARIDLATTAMVKVLDQTDVLSLNSAIETEKAGAHGFGFRVITTEIRRLADQTAKATLEIERMASGIRESVESGVRETKTFQAQMADGIAQVRHLRGEIGAVITDVEDLGAGFAVIDEKVVVQASGAEEIRRALERLNEGAQQIAASSSEFAQVTDQLRSVAVDLRGQVEEFRVGDGGEA